MFVRDLKLGRVMDVTMLGPRGSGKTSLLASLYDQFQDVAGATALELSISDHATRTTLDGYRQDLRRFARGVERERGIEGGVSIREYLFGLGTRGKHPPQMTLRFTDGPGGLLHQSGAERDRLDRAVARSAVLFVAVDSPALMERDGRHNDEINRPELVTDFVRDALRRGGQRLIVFVPLKCEKYVRTSASARELAGAVKARYAALIGHVRTRSDASAAGAVLTPVQTVGSMLFSRFESDGDGVREKYRLINLGGSYAPRDTDQPLRWMLRFAVNAYRGRDKGFWESIGDWWNDTDTTLTQTLRQFGTDCKEQDGFEILVRHPYLELP